MLYPCLNNPARSVYTDEYRAPKVQYQTLLQLIDDDPLLLHLAVHNLLLNSDGSCHVHLQGRTKLLDWSCQHGQDDFTEHCAICTSVWMAVLVHDDLILEIIRHHNCGSRKKEVQADWAEVQTYLQNFIGNHNFRKFRRDRSKNHWLISQIRRPKAVCKRSLQT